MKKVLTVISLGSVALFFGCSSSSNSGYSADEPSAIMAAIGDAVAETGSAMGSSATAATVRSLTRATMTTDDCTSHGDPDGFDYDDDKYPGVLTYCKMSINDGSADTVQGAFELPRGLSCAIERAGIPFDGAPHDVTIELDTNCFTAEQIADMGVSEIPLTVTASHPAAFNSYFDSSIAIEVEDLGNYTVGTKVSGNKIEFVSFEEGDKAGAFAGAFDTSTGELWYEGRMERFDCVDGASCSWNRHIRLYADLAMSGGSPSGLENIQFGYMNVSKPPGQVWDGIVITAAGNLTDGIKARLWEDSNGTPSTAADSADDYDVISNWTENTNSNCYTTDSDTADTCGTGIPLFSENTKFLLLTGQTAVEDFAANFAGMTFTTVDLDTDVQE